MEKRSMFILVILTIVFVVGVGVYIFSDSSVSAVPSVTPETSTTIMAGISHTTTSTIPASTMTPKTIQISMPDKVSINESLSFEPSSIVVVIGTNNTVVWTNNDSVPHTVTAVSVPNGATRFNSGNMDSGTTFTYTFTVPGTYTYDCAYHYWMTGTIVVEQ